MRKRFQVPSVRPDSCHLFPVYCLLSVVYGKTDLMVSLEDFQKLEIRIGKVLSVEKVAGADKLLKFIFDVGSEQRQIIAGMATFFPEPSILVGKEMPVLLNLEPRTFRGQMSHGMIIAADVDGHPVLLHPEREVAPGSMVL